MILLSPSWYLFWESNAIDCIEGFTLREKERQWPLIRGGGEGSPAWKEDTSMDGGQGPLPPRWCCAGLPSMGGLSSGPRPGAASQECREAFLERLEQI